jgi:predicted MPP superfamily phosphohydrolase
MAAPTIGFGPMLYRYWSGLYRVRDRALVVSNGTGNWFPLRSRAPAEIIHLTLRRS